jgi:hypothetical protein
MKKIIFSPLVILLSFWIQPAMAYIDPGSGSAIMSAVIGVFVAVGLAIKTYWYKLKSLFAGKKDAKKTNQEQDSEDKKVS